MTDDVPRPLPQYVYRERTRHGRAVLYFRKGKGERIRLPDDPRSATFAEEYRRALLDLPAPAQPRRGSPGTLEWLIARYQETEAYRHLSIATRKQRDNIFKHVIERGGKANFGAITAADIIAGQETRRATPAQARHFLNSMRGLFRWAKAAQHVTDDPTEGVKKVVQAPKTGGHAPWTDADVAAYEARWPAGTCERVWMHVLRYAGLRRGDAVLFGRQHVKHGLATIKTEKTGTEAIFPMLPELVATLKVGPTGDLTFIVGEKGTPLTKESFGNYFREACKAAGVEKSAHGLRKLCAERAAESGATVKELEAWFGWEGGAMASLYTSKADKVRLARQMAGKMANAISPHLGDAAPHPKKQHAKSNGSE